MTHMSRYLIGIDLGTTNSALAYVDLQRATKTGHVEIKPFPIPQLVAAGETKERPLLPSFLYLPGAHDLPAGGGGPPVGAAPRQPRREFPPHHRRRIPRPPPHPPHSP